MASRMRKNYIVQDTIGDIVAGPTVTVYLTGTVTLANIYSDNIGTGTPLANPFTGGLDGRFFFYADDGQYDVLVVGTGIAPFTLTAENFVFAAAAPAATAINSINGLTATAQFMVLNATGTDAAIMSTGNTHTFIFPTATILARGLLSATDWNTFNSKIGSLNTLTSVTQLFAAGTAGTDFNIVSAGSTHTFNIPTASGTNRGLLSSADWTTFNNKQAALTVGTNLQYVRGDLTNQTLNTSVVPESGNLYYTDARARLSQSATAPLTYNNATGVHAIPKATGAVDGYLAAADFTTFTNGLLTTGTQTIAGQKTFSSPILDTKDVDIMLVDTTRSVRTSTTTVSSSAGENTLTSITLGGAPSAGRVYRIHTGGDVRVGTGGADTFRYRVYIGGTVVADTGAIDFATVTAIPYDLWVDLTVRTAGAAGIIQANGYMLVNDGALGTDLFWFNTNTTAITLTGTPILKTTEQFSVGDATNVINERTAVIQILN